MKWRKKEWPNKVYSIVTIEINEIETGKCDVIMNQKDVPIQDGYNNPTVVENVTNGWKELIFNRINKVLGYGISDP